MTYFDNQKMRYYGFMIYAVIVFLFINIISFSWFNHLGLDVTAEKRFGVSNDTLRIIDKIPETVDLKLYVSGAIYTQMPIMKNYVDRVQDFLQQLSGYSQGRLRVKTILVEPFSEQEDQAIALGLQAVPIKESESIFFGVVAENMLDGEGIIPFFSPEREAFIEYDIARLIQGMIQTQKIKIAVASSLPMETGSGGTTGVLNGKSNPYYTFQALQKRYDLIGLSSDYKELLDVNNRPNIALILHPRPLSKQANNNLKQYIATGGRALIAVDPLSEALPLPIGSTQQNAELYSDMPEFFKFIGVAYDNHRIILDRNLAHKVVNPQTAHRETYLTWLKLTNDNFNVYNPAMTSLKELSASTVGSVMRDNDYQEHLQFTPLIYASQKADFITREKMISLRDVSVLNDNYTPKQTYNMALLVTGKVTKNAKDTAIIVIADSDFLDDRLWLQPTNTGDVRPVADNVNLLLNYTDFLAGDDSLIALRGKKIAYRPLDYLETIKDTAEAKFTAEEQKLKQKIEKLRTDIMHIETVYAKTTDIARPEKIKQKIENFSEELAFSRKKLREVRRNVHYEIKNAERNIKLINMVIVPSCFGILALFILIVRQSKMRSLNQKIKG